MNPRSRLGSERPLAGGPFRERLDRGSDPAGEFDPRRYRYSNSIRSFFPKVDAAHSSVVRVMDKLGMKLIE
jgi:hypothetical protein